MIMMALLHMTGLENSECIWKNPAHTGSGCIHFNNIIISLEIKYKYTGSNTSSVTNEWSLTVTDLNLVVSITRSYIAQFFLLNRLNRLWKKFLTDNNLCDLVAGFQYRVKANVWMNDDISESVNITREMLLKYYLLLRFSPPIRLTATI
jgi:hypothetical protein